MKIPTVRVEFHDLPDIVISKEEYDDMGKWHGLIKNFSLEMKWVKKLHHVLMDTKEYPSQAWEG